MLHLKEELADARGAGRNKGDAFDAPLGFQGADGFIRRLTVELQQFLQRRPMIGLA